MPWIQLPIIGPNSGCSAINQFGGEIVVDQNLFPVVYSYSDIFTVPIATWQNFYAAVIDPPNIGDFQYLVHNIGVSGKHCLLYSAVYPSDFGFQDQNTIYISDRNGELGFYGQLYTSELGIQPRIIVTTNNFCDVLAAWPSLPPNLDLGIIKSEILNAINATFQTRPPWPCYDPESAYGYSPYNYGNPIEASLYPLNPNDWNIEHVTTDPTDPGYFRIWSDTIQFWAWNGLPAEFKYYPPYEWQEPIPSSTKFGGTSMVTGEQALKNVQANHAAINVFNNNSGLGAYGFVQNQDYPIFQDNLSHYVPWATLKAFVAETLNLSWTQGSFTLPDSGGQTQKMLPSQLTAIAGELSRVEPNTNDFFTKQEHVWEAEARFFDFLIKEIEDRCEETKLSYSSGSPTLPEGLTEEIQTFGPFVVLTRDSESNKGYKYNNLAGWVYRSLIKTIEFTIIQKTISVLATDYSNTVISDPLSPSYYRITGIPTFEKIPTEILDTAPLFASPEIASHADNFATWQTWMQTKFPGLSTRTIASAQINDYEGVTGVIFYGDDGPQLFRVGGTWGNNYSVSYQLEKQETQVSPCVTTNLGFTEIIGHGQYDALGVFAQTDAIPEPYVIPDPCLVVPARTSTVLLGDSKIVDPTSLLALDTTIDAQLFHLDIPPLIIPASTILLRDGSPAPIYPVKEGAFVYDLHLKKWGKLRQQYKELLDFSPINTQTSQTYPHEVFGIQAAMLDGNGNFYVFDDKPVESELTYGKVGFFRKGLTAVEEVVAEFKKTSTGEVIVEGSLDGKTIDPSLSRISSFTDAVNWRDGFSTVARWFNIKIRGIWDLCYLEFRGHKKGNR